MRNTKYSPYRSMALAMTGAVPDSFLPWGHRRTRSGGTIWYDGSRLFALDYAGENPLYFAIVFLRTDSLYFSETVIVVPTIDCMGKKLKIRMDNANIHSTCLSWSAENDMTFALEIDEQMYSAMCSISPSHFDNPRQFPFLMNACKW